MIKKYLIVAVIWASSITNGNAFNCYFCICEIVLASAFIEVEKEFLDDKLIPKMVKYANTLDAQTKIVDHIIESATHEYINLEEYTHEIQKKGAILESIRQNHKTATRLRVIEQKIRSVKMRFNLSAKTARELERIQK